LIPATAALFKILILMIRIYFALYLACLCQASGQWTNFEFSDAEPHNKAEIIGILRHGALSVGHTPFYLSSTVKRLKIGFNVSRGFDFSGSKIAKRNLNLIPVMQGSFAVSSNLNLRGKIGIFSSSNLLSQLSSFGFGLELSKPAQNSLKHWELDVELGRLRSSSLNNLSMLEVSLKYKFRFGILPVFAGLGSNQLKGRVFYAGDTESSSKIKTQINYIMGGVLINMGSLKLSPQLTISSNFMSLFLDFYKEFN